MRNIPAHAGKTWAEMGVGMSFPEHPRARGENAVATTGKITFYGTSPRTRGKLKHQSDTWLRVRNIPAHAGKTRVVSVTIGNIQEHPRARGENASEPGTLAFANGTSPRTRGKPNLRIQPKPHLRNIPAHAGKTLPGWMP